MTKATYALKESLRMDADQTSYAFVYGSALAANTGYLLFINARHGTLVTEPTTVTGMTDTSWALIGTALSSNSVTRVSLYRTVTGAAPSGTTLTVDYVAVTMTVCQAAIITLGSVALTNNGADFVLQWKPAPTSGTAASGTVTLDTNLASTDSTIVSAWAHSANEATTPGAEATTTELFDTPGANPINTMQGQYREVTAVTDLTTGASWASTVRYIGGAAEIVGAAAAAVRIPYRNVMPPLIAQ